MDFGFSSYYTFTQNVTTGRFATFLRWEEKVSYGVLHVSFCLQWTGQSNSFIDCRLPGRIAVVVAAPFTLGNFDLGFRCSAEVFKKCTV